MTDLRIVQQVTDVPVEAVTLDFLLTPAGTLDTSQELATAVTVALGTDRLANRDDVLPDPDSDDRRGWWGDLDAAEIHDGWPIGSRIWLLDRAKITGPGAREGSLLARVEAYAHEALQPFIDKGICSRIAVRATRMGLDGVELRATLFRGPEREIELRYAGLWNGIQAV